MQLLALSILGAFLMTASSSDSFGKERDLPFATGEKLYYRAKWGLVDAGRAMIEVGPPADVQGARALHFTMATSTSAVLEGLYKVRERIDSFTDQALTRTLLYTKRSEGKHPRDVSVTTDWNAMTATYSNSGKAEAAVQIIPGTLDPLSVIYAIRAMDLRENLTVAIPVTDGKKCVAGSARVLRREKIDMEGTTYDTYLVEPSLEGIGGIFKDSDRSGLHIWFTADNRKLPVRIRSKAPFGTFEFTLISCKPDNSGGIAQ